jgi:hypothetical protein
MAARASRRPPEQGLKRRASIPRNGSCADRRRRWLTAFGERGRAPRPRIPHFTGGGHGEEPPRVPDGRGGRAARAVRAHPRPDRKATSARPSPMLTLERVQRKAAGGRAASGVRPRGAAVRRDGARRRPDPRGGRHDGRKPLPARSRGRYPSPGTGMGSVHLGNVALDVAVPHGSRRERGLAVRTVRPADLHGFAGTET